MPGKKIDDVNPLLHRLELTRAIIETSPDMINLVDEQGKVLFANQRAVDLLGYASVDQIIGKNVLSFVPVEEQERVKDDMAAALQGGSIINSEYPALRVDGSILNMELNTTMLEGLAGLPRCYLVISRDITRRKQLEKAFQKILDKSLQGIIVVQDQHIVYFNQAATDIFGYSLEELKGITAREWIKYIHPDDLDLVNSRLSFRAKNDPISERFEFRVLHKNGGTRWVETLRTDTDYNGSPAVQISLIDQTDRKNAEIDFRNTMEQYQTLAEAAEDTIYITDQDDKILYMNNYGLELLGKDREGVVGQNRDILITNTAALKLKETRHEVFVTGKSIRVDDQIPSKLGLRWYSTKLVPIRNAAGGIISVMGIARDIQDQKLMDMELKHAKSQLEKRVAERTRELETSQRQLHQLTYQMVNDQEEQSRQVSRELHDEAGQALIALKFNLATVLDELPEDNPSLRHRVSESIALVDQTMARVRSMAHRIRPPELDVAGLNLSLQEFCRNFSDLTNFPIEYHGSEIPGLPEAISINLYRFVQEAVTNVAKHAQAKFIDIKLSYSDGLIYLSVIDDGKGFDPGNRSGGIGLLGINERIQLLGGKLDISTRPDHGTRITAMIPWVSGVNF
jgi:PAS domain S-box-containing protein